MKRFVFASHHSMATGLRDTIQFLTSTDAPLYDIAAYMGETGDEDLVPVVASLFSQFDAGDKVIVMTDIMSGSVNQKFFPYMSDNVFLISGANVPLAMQLVLADEDELTSAFVEECIVEARNQISLLNTRVMAVDEDDE